MLPVLVVIGFGRGWWLLPIPLPVFLLWPFALVPIVHWVLVRHSRAMHLLRVAGATRGLCISVRGPKGVRLLVQVI